MTDRLSCAEARGAWLAERIAARYRTRDVFEIARQLDLRIVYEHWPLVTIGECDVRAREIRVNVAALEQAARAPLDREQTGAQCLQETVARLIVAHELGHFVDARCQNRTAKLKREECAVREALAHAFARRLLKMKISPQVYEQLWRRRSSSSGGDTV